MAKLSDLIRGYKQDFERVHQRSCQAMTELVVYATPIDTHSAINSWTPNKGGPVANNVTIDSGSPPSRGKFLAVTASLKIGGMYSLANGKDYIRALEHGYSGQAPAGMLHVNVARWPQVVREAAGGA